MNGCNDCKNAFAILGKKWNGEIIDRLLSSPKALRFSEIAKSVPACSEKVLTDRLKELESIGIIERIADPVSKQMAYGLTKVGKATESFMPAINQWAKTYL